MIFLSSITLSSLLFIFGQRRRLFPVKYFARDRESFQTTEGLHVKAPAQIARVAGERVRSASPLQEPSPQHHESATYNITHHPN